MNIFKRFYNWVFEVKPESKQTPIQKFTRPFRQCIYAIANKIRPDQSGYIKQDYSSKKGSPSQPPMQKGDFHSSLETNWHNRMNSPEKKMSRGAQNIFRIIKSRFSWGNKNLWRRCDKTKPSATKYGKPHRGHDN